MQSFLSSRPVIKSDKPSTSAASEAGFRSLKSTARVDSPAALAPSQNESEPPTEPRVEIVNGDGRIDRIIVTCTCCKRIELDCEY